jgi:iron complex outermembrane receptor protein
MKMRVAPLFGGLIAAMLFLAGEAIAQNKSVKGKVTDAQGGAAVSGVSILVKGTTSGAQSGADGTYSIDVPANATLVFSAIGYATQEIVVGNRSEIDVVLEAQAAKNLNEVVVVGYGSRKVKDLTGSVANVTTKDFNKGQIASPEQLLEGRTPGVLITQTTGEPGAAVTVNIRGAGSISGRQEPLYVVDGVPLLQGGTLGSASGVEGGTTPKNPLIFLNPQDIESMTILKDASAAAIYGSRGANGVILITTKSGKGGKKGMLNFSASGSIAEAARTYDLLGPQEFLQSAKAANILAGATPADAENAVKLIDGGANTDWQDEIFRQSFSQNYNLSWGMSHKGTTLRLSGGYDNQQGIIENSALQRLAGRVNVSQKLLNDKLRIDANLTYSRTENEYPPLSNNAGYQGSLLGAALQFNPTNPIRNPDGSYFQPGDQRNPVQMLDYFRDEDYLNRFLGNLSASYQITKTLSAKAVFGLDNSKTVRTAFADPRLGSNAYGGTTNIFGRDLQNGIQGNGRMTEQELTNQSFLFEGYLTYDQTFGKHGLNAVLGYSFQNFDDEYKGRVGWGLNTPVVNPSDNFIEDVNNFKNYADFVPGFANNKLQSVFARVNYTYNDRYFLTATVRNDASSKFGENNRNGTFPAFAAKWRLSEEEFAKNGFLGNLFSDISLRANYGVLGSQDNLGPYAALNLQQTYDPGTGSITRFITQGNPDLRWEEVATTGFGIDLTTKDRRLSATVDYFKTKRTNMLFLAPTPGGFAPTANWWINLDGEVVNKGWEFGVNWRAVATKKFSWEINANMTLVENTIEGLPTPINTGSVSGQGLTGAFAQILTNGQPIYSWSMLRFNGFDGNGFARYGEGAQNVIAGTAVPDMFAGLTNTFTWGNLSLSVFLNTVRGFSVYNNTANALFLKGSLRNGRNVTREVGLGPEHPFNPGSVSTRFLEKGDFVRLSNVNINYNVPLKSGGVIKTLSFFASGQNLALWTDYSGIDPEVNVDKNINGIPSRGFDYTQYPRPRVVTFGANIGL